MIMLKNNKQNLIVSSILILLPIIVGLIFWNELPAQMARHWGADGSANGYSPKALVVFGLPLILLALHLLCVHLTYKDPKNKEQSQKVFGIIWWICPVISIFTEAYIYAFALGRELDITLLCSILVGLLLVVFGNYFPKMKQNSTIGIRTKWTCASEKNWYATHRVCSKVWIVCGLLFMTLGFLPDSVLVWAAIAIILVLTAVPLAYSSWYHRAKE